MIDIKEQGRNLVFTLPDDTTITVKPVNGKVGAAIFRLWLGILTGKSTDIDADSVRMGHLAVGGNNVHVIEGDDVDDDGNFVDKDGNPIPDEDTVPGLRFEEAEYVINAAMFWQMQGGGWKTVVEYMVGGLPKAILLILQGNGFPQEDSQSTSSPNGESANPTNRGAFGVTTIPDGSAT